MAQAYTRRFTKAHQENFPVLSWAVAPRLRQHFANIYAFCRWSDELGDEIGDPDRSLALLDWWETELVRAHGGKAEHPVMIALADTIDRFSIPPALFHDLIGAFRRDQTQTRYATFADLLGYCRYSANPVGRLVLHLFGHIEPERLRDSDSLCTGLQLANFWQDIARDRARGRVYVPAEDLERFGVSASDLDARAAGPSLRALLRFQIERAEDYLHQGLGVAVGMPWRPRAVLRMFGLGGLAILHQIRRADYDVLGERIKLSRWNMLRVMGDACLGLGGTRDLSSRRWKPDSTTAERSLATPNG